MLRVINTQRKNARNQPFSYDLMTPRTGTSRHFGKDKKEACTQHDFWVTRNKPNEMKYYELPKYIQDPEPIEDTDVVLWYMVGGHHEPRSEDGEMQKGRRFEGATHLMWTSFELRPRNIWDRSPFYPYQR
jgi:primary-amine oxidase